jgi:O-antigen/teichoic acid export membrane protein
MSNKAPLRQRFPGISSILRNGALLAGTQWVETGIRAVYAILIGRLLGPDLYGAWSLALATYAFAIGFTHFGIETLLPLRLGRDKKAGAFIGTTFVVRLSLVILATILTAACILTFESDLFSRTALLIVLPALIGRGLVLWARTVFVGLEKNDIAFRIAVLFRLLELAAGLTCLWIGLGLYTLLIIHAATWLGEAALSVMVLSRQTPFKLKLSQTEFQSFKKKGAILGLGAMGLSVLLSMPIILTRYVSDDIVVVGQIAIAMQVAGLVVMVVQGLFTAALPVVSRASVRGDVRLKYYGIIAGMGVSVLFGLAVALAHIFGPDFFALLLGEEFRSAGSLLTPALIAAGIMVAPVGVWQIFITQDRIWLGVVASWLGATVLLLALPFMMQAFGASGALFAAAFGWAVRAVVLFVALKSARSNTGSPI